MDKFAEIIRKAEESSKLRHVTWDWERLHGLDFAGVDFETVTADNVPQEVYFLLVEFAFFEFGSESYPFEGLQDVTDMRQVASGSLLKIRISSRYTTQ